MKEKQIIIYEGVRSKWQIFVAAVLFSVSILVIFSFFVPLKIVFFEYLYYAHWMGKVFLLAYIIPVAINNSSVKVYSFDLKNMRYKKEFTVGPIKYGKWKKFKHLEYVSIYKQPLKNSDEHIFDINLWMKDYKHLTISRYNDLYFEEAFEMGFQVANTLGVSYLDSTADLSQDWDWVDLHMDFDSLIKRHPKYSL